MPEEWYFAQGRSLLTAIAAFDTVVTITTIAGGRDHAPETDTAASHTQCSMVVNPHIPIIGILCVKSPCITSLQTAGNAFEVRLECVPIICGFSISEEW